MVAKRRKRRAFATEEEAFLAALAKVPVSDEDPETFWGPNWKEEWERAEAERAAGPRQVYYTLDEFFAALDQHAK